MGKLLAQSSFWTLNKHIAKKLGSNDAALLLAELSDIHDQHPDKEVVFRSQEKLMESCNLTVTGLRNAMKILFDAGLVGIEKIGLPATNHYKVYDDKVLEILSAGFLSTSHQSSGSLSTRDQGDSSHINKQDNNNQYKETIGVNKEIYNNTKVNEVLNIPDNVLVDTPDSQLNKDQLVKKATLLFEHGN